MKRWVFLAVWMGLSMVGVQAVEPAVSNTTAVVVFHGKELFTVSQISSVPADTRAETLLRRFKRQAKSPLISTKKFTVHEDTQLNVSVLMSGSEILCAVWPADADYYDMPRGQLAAQWINEITAGIEQYRKDYTSDAIMKDSLFAALATLVFIFVWIVLHRLKHKEIELVTKKFTGQKMLKFLDGDSLVMINEHAVKFIFFVVMLTVAVVWLNIVLSFFPWTYNLSAHLYGMISSPVINFGHAFISDLPDLFTLLVIGTITHFVLRSLKHIFVQIGEGKVRIKGFYQDWADTTYGLIRIVVIIFAMVAAFPSIPGSGSPAFKGISIFMGVLFSLGSTSAVGNIFGGLMLTYMRSFMPGDFVEINGMKGTVMSRRMFSTRMKTPTNEIINIPNVSVSTNPITNYSRMAKNIGVNVGTSITIGYDVPWRTVHELLSNAAEGVTDVQDDPPPSILQLALDDFYVKYKLIVTTQHPEHRIRIRSDLHKNIQDQFAKANIEIMSPHYQSNRNGEPSTLPNTGSADAR